MWKTLLIIWLAIVAHTIRALGIDGDGDDDPGPPHSTWEHGESSCSPRSLDAITLTRPPPHVHTEETCGERDWRGSYCSHTSGFTRKFHMSCVIDHFEAINGRPRAGDEFRLKIAPDWLAQLAYTSGQTPTLIRWYIDLLRVDGYCSEGKRCVQLDGLSRKQKTGRVWSKDEKPARPMPRIACVSKEHAEFMVTGRLPSVNARISKAQQAVKWAAMAADKAVKHLQDREDIYANRGNARNWHTLERARAIYNEALLRQVAAEQELQAAVSAAEASINPYTPMPPDFGQPDPAPVTEQQHFPWDLATDNTIMDESWREDEYIAEWLEGALNDMGRVAAAAANGQLALVYEPPPGPSCGKPP